MNTDDDSKMEAKNLNKNSDKVNLNPVDFIKYNKLWVEIDVIKTKQNRNTEKKNLTNARAGSLRRWAKLTDSCPN